MKLKSVVPESGRHYFVALPAVFLMVFWPCLVHMDLVKTHLENETWYPDMPMQYDFFMHIRSKSLAILSAVMFLMILDYWLLQKKKIFYIKKMWPLLVYAGMALVSTIFSVNQKISVTGMPEQYENIWTIISYLVVIWFFWLMSDTFFSMKNAVACLLAGCFVQCLIGFSQMLRHDFWGTFLGLKLMGVDQQTGQMLGFTFESTEKVRIYLSFYNPNYAAVYLIMMIPVAVFSIRMFTKIWQKLCCEIVVGGAVICLWGTGSKTALIVIVMQVLLGIYLLIKKRSCQFLFVGFTGIVVILSVMFFSAIPGNNSVKKIKESIFRKKVTYALEKIEPENTGVRLKFRGHSYQIMIETSEDGNKPWVTDENERACMLSESQKDRFIIDGMKGKKPEISVTRTGNYKQIMIYWNRFKWIFESSGKNQSFYYVNPVGKQDVMEEAPAAFGKGREKNITGRIYIWGRAVPLLRKTLIWGKGPDTFACVFPQNDYIARANTGKYMIEQLLTKAHNIYLQISIQTGVLSLAALLYFVTKMLKITVIKLQESEQEQKCWYMALILAIVGFLLMGLTNDSVVVTTPIFCVIIGLAMNERIENSAFLRKQ